MVLALAALPGAPRAQPAVAARPMRIGVIGAGRLGGAVGSLWVKAGHEVRFASRHPEELKPLVDGLGGRASAGTVAEAIAFGEVLLLAVPYRAVPEVGKEHAAAMRGKVVLDATNAFRERDGAAGEEAIANGIGLTTAKYLPGARVVRAFNFTGAAEFTRDSNRPEGRIAVPIAGDDRAALDIASQLVRDAGFEPVVVGGLSTANRFAPGGPLFRQMGSADEMRKRLGQ
jgi:predicted dinucleotide-binding enzyme